MLSIICISYVLSISSKYDSVNSYGNELTLPVSSLQENVGLVLPIHMIKKAMTCEK